MRRWNGLSGLLVCGLVAGMVALPTQAAAWVAFAKITTSNGTITGGATQKGYEGQIEVLGLGSSLDLPVESSPTTGVSVGRLQLGRFQFVKVFDIATPRLVTQVASSLSLPKVEFTIFKTTTTGTSVPGFRITLTNAILTKLEPIYDPGATPSTLEKVELFYNTYQWTDLITGATGTASRF